MAGTGSLGVALATSGLSAAPPLLTTSVDAETVRSGADDRISVTFTVQTREEAVRVPVDIATPQLSDTGEPIGSFLKEESARVEGAGTARLTQAQADFLPSACVQGSVGITSQAVLEVPANATASLILRYTVGRVPVGRSPQVRFTARPQPGPLDPVVALSPPVRVTGRRLPRLTLRTSPRSTTEGRAFRRPRSFSVHGTASPELRGERVTVGVAGNEIQSQDLYLTPLARHRTIGAARVDRAGAFRLRAPFRTRRGRAYQLVARTRATRTLSPQSSCPRRLRISSRGSRTAR